MTTRHPVERDEVMAYLDGELPAERAGVVRAHLETCDGCRALADDLRQVSATLEAWQAGDAPARLTQQVERAMHAGTDGTAETSRSWPRWPAFPTFPRWTLAAASLAGAALVLAVVVPRQPAAPDAAGQMAGRQTNEQPAAPTETLARPDRLRDEEAGPGRTEGGVAGASDRAELQAPARAEPAPPTVERPAAPAQATAAERRATQAAPPAAAPAPPARPVGQAREFAMAARPAADMSKVAGQGAAAGEAAVQLEAVAAASALRPIDLVIPAADLDEARRSIEELLRSLDGWLADATTSGTGDEPLWRAELLVPAGRVEQFLDGLRRLGTLDEGPPADQATADRLADAASRLEREAGAERRELAAIALRVRSGRDLARDPHPARINPR